MLNQISYIFAKRKGSISGRLATSFVLAGIIISSSLLTAIPDFSSVPAYSQMQEDESEQSSAFVDSIITTGLDTPTSMAFSPDGRVFVAEKGGDLRVIRDGILLDTPFLSVDTEVCCERGLLGVALDPDFETNGFVYVYYTTTIVTTSSADNSAGPIHNRVSRFTADPLNPDVALLGSELPILDLEPLAPNFHNGGAIHFGPDGKLYIAAGDNYIFENSQMLTTRLGKILRINSDGSIPDDNPFYNTPGAKKEIWALGVRNPFTFAFSSSGVMYINDVGHDWAEEINAGAAGANYGWPRCEGACLNPDFVDPVYAYTHEDGSGKAITGGAFYEADQFPAEYRGSYFFGDYVLGFIKRLMPGSSQVVDFLATASSPVDIDVGPDGSLYYLSIGEGTVHRVHYNPLQENGAPTANITIIPTSSGPILGAPPLEVTFDGSTSADPEGDPLSYSWDFGDGSEISSGAVVNHTYNAAGSYTAKLTVDDGGRGGTSSATANVIAGNPPIATIESPAGPRDVAEPGTPHYSAGDVIFFSGSGFDAEDGALPDDAFNWQVILHHNTHTHPFTEFEGIRSGNFTVPRVMETAPDVWFRIYLTVRDSSGLESVRTVDIHPNRVDVVLNSNIPQTQIFLDGQPETVPHFFTGITGVTRTLEAPVEQVIDGQIYRFQSWSDGGELVHTIDTPPSAANSDNSTINNSSVTYSAEYAPVDPELTLITRDLDGRDVTGMWAAVSLPNGTALQEGYTPLTFTGGLGQEYAVTVEDQYGGISFDHWGSNGESSANTTTTVQLLSSQQEVVAYYKNTDTLGDYVESPAHSETGNGNSTRSTAIYFPLYAPPGPLWDNMLTYRQAHPDLPWIAIVDPHHGPGQQYDPIYAQNISRLQANNVVVLGYVSTLWSQKDSELVKQEISKYKEWYDVDGILLDEMVSFAGAEGLYSEFTEFAKSLGINLVIGNVGTNTQPSYIGTIDAISTVEGDRTPPLSWLKGWQLNYDKSNFLYITYSQSWIDPQYVAESAKYVGSLYITDDTMPFPYDDFPAYFDEVVAVLDPRGDNSLRNLSVRAADLRGNGLNGTIPMTISDGTTNTDDGAPIATLYAPLAHVGTQGSTYMVTALSNRTHTFDHWDDGSTNPSRNVTLDSSKILRAYYRTPALPDLQSNIVVNALTVKGGQLEMYVGVAAVADDDSGEGIVTGATPLVFEGQEGKTYTVTANDFQDLVFDHWEDGTTSRTRTVSVQGDAASAYLTAYYRVEAAPWLADATVDTYTIDGTEIRGLWSTIAPLGEQPAAGMYTPATFEAESGVAYVVSAEDSSDGIYVFDHWGDDDGSTDRVRTVTPLPGEDVTLTAYYRTAPVSLTVKSADVAGNALNGMYTTVAPINNSTIQESFTNSTYIGYVGSAYKVTAASDYAGMVFDHWEDGTKSNSRTVVLQWDNREITGHYRTADSVMALTPATHVSEDGVGLTVNAVSLEGSSLNMWSIIQPVGDGTYKVFVHDYEGYTFDHWEDGSTNRVRTVTIEEATMITAYYRTG